MLQIFHSLAHLPFAQLMEIYIEGNLEKTAEGITLLEAEQDFYCYLREVFFSVPGACYCLWQENGCYVSALRLEPYQDGWLLEALETRPDARRRGYGKKLVDSVKDLPQFGRIYSHIHKKNLPSVSLHEGCGFRKILDYGVYIDGSVNRYTGTYCYETEKK